ncbi:hypothetical protein AHAT_25840 [Agarivorans sp. Toyoura001]|nr:hypothetical protein AHAT_25840 [Agarivorans sp. Toyoura001]
MLLSAASAGAIEVLINPPKQKLITVRRIVNISTSTNYTEEFTFKSNKVNHKVYFLKD